MDSEPNPSELISGKTKYVFTDLNEDPMMLCMAYDENFLPCYRAYPFGTIRIAGMYKLSTKVTSQISITVGNVTLDLNGNTVTGGIVINSGLSNIALTNGTVDVTASTGITVNAGCTNIKIADVVVRGAVVNGINFSQVNDSIIKNCEFVQNGTGLQLDTCRNVTVSNCTAQRNVAIGFSLLSSTTCSILDCKALGTGFNNTLVTNNLVSGFDARNGVGNIFDRCIANSTLSLSVTDADSILAGFSLRGNETRSRILNCQASNSITNPNSLTVPYGILLQATLGSQVTLTAVPVSPVPSGNTNAAWDPSGQYIAEYNTATPGQIRVYLFNRSTFTLTQVAQATNSPVGVSTQKTFWSASGTYFACIAYENTTPAAQVAVYQFNKINNSVTLIPFPSSSADNISLARCAWHPSEQFFVTCGQAKVRLYSFDRIAGKFTFLQQINPNVTDATFNDLQDARWSPDGNFLAVGVLGGSNPATGYRVLVFDRGLQRFGNVINADATLSSNPRSVDWSPDGKFVAATASGTSPVLAVYAFNKTAQTLTRIASTSVDSVSGRWSADGRFIIVSLSNPSSINVYSFKLLSPTSATLNSVATSNISFAVATQQGDLSPDGGFAVIGTTGASPLNIYQILSFPSENVIKNNTVYCNSGETGPNGFGISGSSICNLIIQNTVYSTPLNPNMVPNNYAFVCNVFNPLFNAEPTLMQNISVGQNEAIPTVPDIPLMVKQALSKVDFILSKVNALLAAKF